MPADANQPTRSNASRPTPGEEGNVKETIESILVAFILAFIFRAFVVEAFVIPTGSMGPTLMGAHMRVQCPDCGYRYAVNFSTSDPDGTDVPAFGRRGIDFHCPNCGYDIPASSGSVADASPVFFGDRILVLKYRYLFQNPDRWDVVVFKSPYEKKPDRTDPKYTDNYIKRLVGRPMEAVMILDGDVYIGRHDSAPEQFVIQHKPPHVQDALWRVVYDNDYIPQGLNRGSTANPWRQPWRPVTGDGWQMGTGTSRVLPFENLNGSGAVAFDPDANPHTHALTDWLAYDQYTETANVSDMKLSCMYRRLAGTGPLQLQFTKRDDCFTAVISPGKVSLRRTKVLDTEPLKLAEKDEWQRDVAVPALAKTEPARIEMVNLDYRVAVRVNGKEVLATDDALYSPDVKALYDEAIHGRSRPTSAKPIVRIAAERQRCTLEHVALSRDIYYINSNNVNNNSRYTAEGGPSGKPFWASPAEPIKLGPDEYFVLGDNSQVSLDARFWGAPVELPREGLHADAGRVPGRFMLGKAFFVYWPAGYRPGNLPYGIIPDFGDMRFIH